MELSSALNNGTRIQMLQSLCCFSRTYTVNFCHLNCPHPVLLKSALTFMAPLYCVAQWVQFAPSWAWVDYRAKVSVSDDTTEENDPSTPDIFMCQLSFRKGCGLMDNETPHAWQNVQGPILSWISTDFMRAAPSSPEDVLLLLAFPCSGSHSLPASPMVFNEYRKVCDKALLFRPSTPPIT